MINKREWDYEEEEEDEFFDEAFAYDDEMDFDRVVGDDLGDAAYMEALDAAFMYGYFDDESPYIFT